MMDTLLKIIVFKVNLIQVAKFLTANFKMAAEIEPPFCFCVIKHLMRVYKFNVSTFCNLFSNKKWQQCFPKIERKKCEVVNISFNSETVVFEIMQIMLKIAKWLIKTLLSVSVSQTLCNFYYVY